jgi:hypothetical protein
MHNKLVRDGGCLWAGHEIMFAASVANALFAASSWPAAVLLAVPVFVLLFGLAFTFARNSRQRLANLLLGLLGSITVMWLSLWYLFEASQIPLLRCDDYIPIVAPTSLTVGAAIGVGLSVVVRKCLSLLTHTSQQSDTIHPSE